MSAMLSIKHWNFPDPAPNIPISQIPRVSERAIALMARNRDKPLLNTDFLRIYGAVEMVAGMEYHYENFVRLSISGLLANEEMNSASNMRQSLTSIEWASSKNLCDQLLQSRSSYNPIFQPSLV
jgi:hypothetical protein